MSEQQALSPRASRAAALLDALFASAQNAALHRLVQAATIELGADGALLSLLTDRQVVIAADGSVARHVAPATELSFDDTICANVLRSDDPLSIPDTERDARVSSAPIVRDGDLGAYLGAPVRCHGDTVGVLCVYGHHARPWSQDNIAALTQLANQAGNELARRFDTH